MVKVIEVHLDLDSYTFIESYKELFLFILQHKNSAILSTYSKKQNPKIMAKYQTLFVGLTDYCSPCPRVGDRTMTCNPDDKAELQQKIMVYDIWIH